MFLSIYHNQSGEHPVLRRLAPNESLDLRAHVRKWIETLNAELDEPVKASFSEYGAHIGSGCGEYEAEIRHTKKTGSSCWTSEPFFVVPEDEEAA